MHYLVPTAATHVLWKLASPWAWLGMAGHGMGVRNVHIVGQSPCYISGGWGDLVGNISAFFFVTSDFCLFPQ